MRQIPALMLALPMGVTVAVVGFASSFPIVLLGLAGVGASAHEAASGLSAAALAMAAAGIVLSLRFRMPISVAWSTPGVALLAVTGADAGGFAAALGAFALAGALTVLAGMWRPLARAVAAVPAPLAQAMMAGVLLNLVLPVFRALPQAPLVVAPILGCWFVVSRFSRLFAVPAAALVALGLVLTMGTPVTLAGPWLTLPQPMRPDLTLGAVIGIALPLFIVTMATQNIPGLAVLRANGYAPPPGPCLRTVGAASVISAPFGAPATCLAAVTAALCTSPDAHPDPAQRWWAAIFAGLFYAVFGLFAGVIVAVAQAAPEYLLASLTGVALISVFGNSAAAAWTPEPTREAAVVTFVVTASGVSLAGLGAPVWGLAAGLAVLGVARLRRVS